MTTTPYTIFITGAAGYIGGALADQLSKRSDVSRIVCLDKEPMPAWLQNNEKIIWMRAYTCANDWQKTVAEYKPNIVIHTAWQIKTLFGKRSYQEFLNITGSKNVFDFAFGVPSVTRLVHFSTIASYGAGAENTLETIFDESSPFRKTEYQYAEEKRVVEALLEKKYQQADAGGHVPEIAIIRPASITGPRARSLKHKTGLQSVLTGKKGAGVIHRLMSLATTWMPITKGWMRQFVHEDDIIGIAERLALGELQRPYEIVIACPPGDIVTGSRMAELVQKKTLSVSPYVVRGVFAVAWWLSLGRIPTSPGGWKTYSYPIRVTGEKVTREYGYQYQYDGITAFVKNVGTYAGNQKSTQQS